MKKLISISLVLIAIIVGGVLGVQTVSAQSNNQTERCSTAQGRLNTRITRVNTIKDSHTTAYNNLNAKVTRILTSAETNHYDTTALTAAANAVEEKIAAFGEKATAYTDALMATKNLSCGTNDDEFNTSLTAARAALAAVRAASVDVRTTFTTEVIPALQDYATWLKEQLATEEERN